MNIKVKLDRLYGRLSTREPFLLAEGENLTVEFKSDYELTGAIVNLENGKKNAQVKLNGTTFDVPQSLIMAGSLYMDVNLYAYGRIVKTFVVEPIVLTSASPTLKGHPELELIKETLSKQEEIIEDLQKNITELNERINEFQSLREEISNLWQAVEQ